MRKAQRHTGFRLLLLIGALAALIACKKKVDAAAAPLPATTTVSSADLAMRIAPNTTAAEIARLSRGEQVKIVQRSADSVQIGKLNAYWYKVTTSTGLTGWVYGAHLAIESDEGDTQAILEKAEKKLREVLPGRWDAATIQGELTTNFVKLYPDGKMIFGTERSGTQSGKYELLFDGPVAKVVIRDIKKPMMTDIKAKMVGETLVFTAMMGDTEYKLIPGDADMSAIKKPGQAAPAPTNAP
jgi:hypothetical protein